MKDLLSKIKPVRRKIKFVNKARSEFLKTLKSRIDVYFKEQNLSKYCNRNMVIKTSIMLSLYLIPYALLFTDVFTFYQSLLLFLMMGIGMAGIGASVMHDANHGSYSSNKRINKGFGYLLNFLGGNAFIWKLQHNMQHHSYTNIHHEDSDLDGRGLLRFSPHAVIKPVHKFQHIYALLVYSLMTISWVFWKDFNKFYVYIRDGINTNNKKQNNIQLVILILSKLFYIAYIIVLPLVFTDLTWWQVLIGFVVVHVTAGIILSIIFQLAHVVEGTSYPLPDEKGHIENEWAIHQMHNTVNFGTENRFLNWFVGGLNFQVEHHLFPDICHIHYRRIAPIVKSTAREFNIPYMENTTFIGAFVSHLKLLKKLGKKHTL